MGPGELQGHRLSPVPGQLHLHGVGEGVEVEKHTLVPVRNWEWGICLLPSSVRTQGPPDEKKVQLEENIPAPTHTRHFQSQNPDEPFVGALGPRVLLVLLIT